MLEVRFHGRGGQGSVTAAEVLAIAAFKDGKYSQAFPIFGVERRGAPVQAFCRIDEKPIKQRCQVYEPDLVVVQDATLMSDVDVTAGLKEGGILLINSAKSPEEFGINSNTTVKTIDATRLALETLGRPIVNTVMLGALAKLGIVSLNSIVEAVGEKFGCKLAEKNILAVKKAFEELPI
ncbi:pyruvate ferredoxin oxidoreductase subunit gamma [Archaeoglobus veneficus]|uniref:pyruvate synthase n=1 Tax=Archaeoglobus veneficus (strain DSM 11195 / SNP6) TaxID=693661 RepID=F2KRX6_ARCVS|nr:pyruvate ferredoxin oxidoreductase subunit gamma [Archaeoglobus veneficus]AEA46817.1 pyruvate/ketoisovalerate oxidoreductase, gamma subunit [Archaeoglobus veneficus SNP6]